ncbi:MAG: dihydrodipicolinate synthase family protein [Anaerolineaceae bacterium]|nr:dihydrodipicolinate synthase family protein [Anaerolineaceae bacterium]
MYSGIFTALLTPFTSSGEVNTSAIKDLVEFNIEKGVDGLYLCGGTGEGFLLSEQERKLVTETAVKAVNGRIPVITHVGAITTAQAVNLAEHAMNNGASAVASTPPIYYYVGNEGVLKYYHQLAEAAKSPVFFYNVPASAGTSLTAEMAASFYEEGILQGIKYTSSDMLTLHMIMEACKGKITVFSGPDEMFLPYLTMGISGGIGATFNFLADTFVDIYSAYKSGNVEQAQLQQNKVNQTIGVFINYGVIPAVKSSMSFLGIDCGNPREPLVALNEEQKKNLELDLKHINLL